MPIMKQKCFKLLLVMKIMPNNEQKVKLEKKSAMRVEAQVMRSHVIYYFPACVFYLQGVISMAAIFSPIRAWRKLGFDAKKMSL